MTAAGNDRTRATRSAPSQTRELCDRSRFKVWTSDRIRLVDLDFQQHVNNVAYAAFCATGRYNFLQTYLRPLVAIDDVFSIVKLTIEYRSEMSYPGEVDVGTLVRSCGRSSFVFGQGLFSGDVCVATSEGVMVFVDGKRRRATALTPAMIACMQDHLLAPADAVASG